MHLSNLLLCFPSFPPHLQSKSGKELRKRDITLADDSNTSITLTLWGDKTNTPINVGDVVAVKNVRLGEYGGRSLSAWNSSLVDTQADHPDAHRLRGWWARSGGTVDIRSLSEGRGGSGGGGGGVDSGAIGAVELRKTVAQLRDEGIGNSEQGDVATVKASIFMIKHDDVSRMMYPACPGILPEGRTCNKKLMSASGDLWSCERGCQITEPRYRYILSATIGDASGQEYVTLFDEDATKLLGRPANEIHGLQQEVGPGHIHPEVETLILGLLHKEFLFTLKGKMEMVKEEQRVKYTVIKLREIDYARECKTLLAAIQNYSTGSGMMSTMGGMVGGAGAGMYSSSSMM